MLVPAAAVVTLMYLALIVIAAVRLGGPKQPCPGQDASLPAVSVIIAARNEEDRLPALFRSLEALGYPRDKTELLLVDDRSTDTTASLMAAFCAAAPGRRRLTVNTLPEGNSGKINALCLACEEANGEYLLFTDADCRVPPAWASALVSLQSDRPGLTAGAVLTSANSGVFAVLQQLDWAMFSAFGAAWSAMNRPLSVFGNNMCIQKAVYETSGGFSRTENHLTEDFALMKLIKTRTGARISMELDKASLVLTEPEQSVKDFLQQRLRWARGMKGRGPDSWILTLVPAVSLILIFVILLSGDIRLSAALFGLLILSDYILLSTTYRRLSMKLPLRVLPLLKMFQLAYAAAAALMIICKKRVTWKGSPF